MEKWFKGNQDTRSFVEVPEPFAVLHAAVRFVQHRLLKMLSLP